MWLQARIQDLVRVGGSLSPPLPPGPNFKFKV